MKQNIILTGVTGVLTGVTEKEKEDCQQVTKDFLKKKMDLDDVKIDVAHRIGSGKCRPMVIRLANQKQKSRIFGNNINKLKGLKNENN